MPFKYKRSCKVLVQKGFNTILGIGGKQHDLVQFELEWYQNPIQTAEIIKNYKALPCS